MIRTSDATRVNALANHPAIRPVIGWPELGELDFAQFLAQPQNVALSFEHGCFLFAFDEPGRYELHTMIAPEGRGAGVLPAFAEAARFMFVETDATEIVTKVAGSNPAAALMARRAGFQPMFVRSGAWQDGSDLTFFVLTLDRWRGLDPTLAAEGHAFHEALQSAKDLAGITVPQHSDDDAHDRAAGLASLMAKAGNFGKAAWIYNRWARLAGYLPAQIVPQPPHFDIGDAIIRFTPDLEVLQCRQLQ